MIRINVHALLFENSDTHEQKRNNAVQSNFFLIRVVSKHWQENSGKGQKKKKVVLK